MEGTPAIYLGRIVEKKNFRAYIYGANGERRLVESWEEFEANMQSGIWFATIEDANAHNPIVEEVEAVEEAPVSKIKPIRKPKQKAEKADIVEHSDEFLPENDSVFEVIDGA